MLFPKDTVWTGCDGGLLRNSGYWISALGKEWERNKPLLKCTKVSKVIHVLFLTRCCVRNKTGDCVRSRGNNNEMRINCKLYDFWTSRENEITKAFKCHVFCTRPLKHSEGKQQLLGIRVHSQPIIGCKKGEISSQDKAQVKNIWSKVLSSSC